LALSLEHLDAFRDGLAGIADRHERVTPFVRRRTIDAQLSVAGITPDLLSDLDRLRPFGVGNEEPLFLLRDVRVAAISRIGSGGRHLRFALEEDGRRLSGVAFRREEIPVSASGRSDLLIAVQENVYRGARSLQLLLRDARPAGDPVLCEGTPPG
ncbi:MAG: hypothetical protein ACYC9V_11915, partial [Desulfobacteria bacterium]